MSGIVSPSLLGSGSSTHSSTSEEDSSSFHNALQDDVEQNVLAEPAHTTTTPQQHADFWFSDGSVVLLAQDTMFRVHKTFLSRHSIIFRDMFALPQPSSPSTSKAVESAVSLELAAEEAEGRAVVRLHDSAEDVASLLYALYDGPKFGNNDKSDFRVVSGILRLASKYMIDSLRTKALAHLSIAWPSSLKGWDAREEVLGEGPCCSEGRRFYPNPVEVINLAREINAPTLLPSAFYDLSRHGLTEIFENGQRLAAPNPLDSRASLQSLSLGDTQKLVLGKESAHYAVTSLIRSMGSEARANTALTHAHAHAPHGGAHAAHHLSARHRRSDSLSAQAAANKCASPSACWRDACELVDLATQHYLFDRERGAMDPLYVAEELALLKGTEGGGAGAGVGGPMTLSEGGEGGDCRACARAFEVWARRERERMWRAIPGWFRLDQE